MTTLHTLSIPVLELNLKMYIGLRSFFVSQVLSIYYHHNKHLHECQKILPLLYCATLIEIETLRKVSFLSVEC